MSSRNAPPHKGALRDDTKNGCVAAGCSRLFFKRLSGILRGRQFSCTSFSAFLISSKCNNYSQSSTTADHFHLTSCPWTQMPRMSRTLVLWDQRRHCLEGKMSRKDFMREKESPAPIFFWLGCRYQTCYPTTQDGTARASRCHRYPFLARSLE